LPDVEASNGVIHGIDTVLTPPPETAQSDNENQNQNGSENQNQNGSENENDSESEDP